MKVGIISDIHGNIIALQNCYNFFKNHGVEKIYFLGDAIGYLPQGLKVLDFLKVNNIDCLLGNHEAMLLGLIAFSPKNEEVYKLEQIANNINPEQLAFIKSWKIKTEITINNKLFLLVHGSPAENLTGYIYPDSELDTFTDIPYNGIFMGHTHRPFIRTARTKIFVNVGSVGLPRDIGYLSSCCLIESESEEILIYRIPFDIDSVLDEPPGAIHFSVVQGLNRLNNTFVGILTS